MAGMETPEEGLPSRPENARSVEFQSIIIYIEKMRSSAESDGIKFGTLIEVNKDETKRIENILTISGTEAASRNVLSLILSQIHDSVVKELERRNGS